MSAVLIRQLRQAEKSLRTGDAATAAKLCEQVLRKAPRNPDALFLYGTAQLAQARPGDAAATLRRVVEADPRHGAALEHLGLACLMLGRFPEAESVLAKAAQLPGAPASVFMRLGVALLEQGRAAEALAPLQRAVAADASALDPRINLGRALAVTGDIERAQVCFHSAIGLAPQSADAEFNLGVLALQRQEWAEARRWFEQALEKSPSFVDAMVNLGVALQNQSLLQEAAQWLRRALSFAPEHASALTELGHTLARQGLSEAARDQYLAALRIAPDLVAAHEGLAAACLLMGRLEEAIAHLEAVMRVEPGNANACAALAGCLFERGSLEEAEASARRAIELNEQAAEAYTAAANVQLVSGRLGEAIDTLERGHERTRDTNLLGMLTYLLRHACDWTRWEQAWRATEAALDRGELVGRPFWLLCERLTAKAQYDYVLRWSASRFEPVTRRGWTPPPRAEHDRIRIGYLSSDLQEHATAYLMADVLEQHDRSRFEVFAYSHGPADDGPMRRRLLAACEHFIDIAREPDDAAAERMRRDALDVLVDLKGYTAGERLTILARRPCAIQLTWLGYPGTTAASFVDGLIADAFVIPKDAERFYSERVLRMPYCYQPNDRKRAVDEPLCRRDYGLPDEAFVFCCFNQTYKITPDVFAVWMRLLGAIPGAVLWLLDSNPEAKANLASHARQAGIDTRRLVFAPKLPNARHLARYRVADAALDTFPYTSHTTLSDALWCGCPAIALCGETFAARVSGSLLTAAGLPELIAYDLAAYERVARRLAEEPAYLREVRARVSQARESALFNSNAFTRALEDLYLSLVSRA